MTTASKRRPRTRSNGEGSLYRRKSDGKWVGALSYLDDPGIQRRHVAYASTQSEARAKLRAAGERPSAGAPVKDARVRLGAFIEDWIGKGLAASPRKPPHRRTTRPSPGCISSLRHSVTSHRPAATVRHRGAVARETTGR